MKKGKRAKLFALILLPESILLTVFLCLLSAHRDTERMQTVQRIAAEYAQQTGTEDPAAFLSEYAREQDMILYAGEGHLAVRLGDDRGRPWGIAAETGRAEDIPADARPIGSLKCRSAEKAGPFCMAEFTE